MKTLLKADNLFVNYGAIQALRGVSLEVKEGEIVALLGCNGAGKSSLLKSIMRMIPLKSGELFFDGKSILRSEPKELVPQGLSLVPEGRGILATLSVYENLELGAYHRKNWEGDLDLIYELFPRVKERIQQQAGTLSGGEQQMVAIARALLAKPRLLLLDEPSLGLAPKIIQGIFALIKEIQKRGVSILLIEQNAHMALKVADRVLILQNGKIVVSGTADEIKAKEQELRDAYLGG